MRSPPNCREWSGTATRIAPPPPWARQKKHDKGKSQTPPNNALPYIRLILHDDFRIGGISARCFRRSCDLRYCSESHLGVQRCVGRPVVVIHENPAGCFGIDRGPLVDFTNSKPVSGYLHAESSQHERSELRLAVTLGATLTLRLGRKIPTY